jgi:hypothetical protein
MTKSIKSGSKVRIGSNMFDKLDKLFYMPKKLTNETSFRIAFF